jgi:hypothetical protein
MRIDDQVMRLGKLTNQQQADAILIMLLINGRETPSADCFAMCHDNVRSY